MEPTLRSARTKIRNNSATARNGIFGSQKPRFPSRRTALCPSKSSCQERNFWMQRREAKKSALETADVHRDRKSGDDTGEIPAETAFLESPTKCAVWEDWMVETEGTELPTPHAVVIEPGL